MDGWGLTGIESSESELGSGEEDIAVGASAKGDGIYIILEDRPPPSAKEVSENDWI